MFQRKTVSVRLHSLFIIEVFCSLIHSLGQRTKFPERSTRVWGSVFEKQLSKWPQGRSYCSHKSILNVFIGRETEQGLWGLLMHRRTVKACVWREAKRLSQMFDQRDRRIMRLHIPPPNLMCVAGN